MAVDIGSAVGYLDLDISKFSSSLKEAQNEASSSFKDLGQKLDSAGKSMTKIGAVATAGITTPIVTGVGTVIKQFGNLEQSIGGVETLFKDSAGKVLSYSQDAWKTAGLDQNAYLEQATSFSATLLRSLGGDTAAAAEYANMAILDMSDNANKMGTDMSLIQNAYQGFAKQNYSMLDNLKLGYGGTKEEMQKLLEDAEKISGIHYDIDNLNDVFDAIHVIQTELGITGTTAEEASTTVIGSFNSAKSALFSFAQALGNPDADIQKALNDMKEAFVTFGENVKRVLSTLWDNLPVSDFTKKMLVVAAAFGPVMLAAGKVTSAVGTLFKTLDTVTTVAPKIMSTLSSAFSSTATSAAAAGQAASGIGAGFTAALGPILAIVAIVGTLIAAFVTLWNTNEEFRNRIIAIWEEIKSKVQEFTQGIVDRVNSLGFEFESFTELLKSVWMGFCDVLAPLFEGAFQLISDILSSSLDVLTGIFDIFAGLFTGDWERVWTGIKEVFDGVWTGLWNIVETVLGTIKNLTDVFLGWFDTSWSQIWTSVKEFFVNTWDSIAEFFSNIAESIENGVKTFIDNVINFFSDLPYNIGVIIGEILGTIAKFVVDMVAKATELGKDFVEGIMKFFKELPTKVKEVTSNVFNNVKSWATDMASKAKEAAKNFADNVVNGIKNLPNNVKTTTDKILSNVQTWATNLASKAREAARQMSNNIINGIKSLPNQVLSIGRNIVYGLWNGISGAAGWLYNKVRSFANGIITGIKSALGIASPSRVMRDQVGKWLPLGIGEGFEKSLPGMLDGMKDQFNEGIKKFRGKLETFQAEGTIVANAELDSNFENGAIKTSSGFDYDMLAQKMIDVLRQAPISPQVNVDMQDGSIYLDKERVGRTVAPVVSRVIVQST